MIINYDDFLTKQIVEVIEEGNIGNVIKYAKCVNFFDNPTNENQILITQKLQERLASEGLDMDIIHKT